MSFRYGPAGEALSNRKKFLLNSDIAIEDCVAMSLQDSEECVQVSTQDKRRGMTALDGIAADCLVTKEKRLFLFTFVADCLPLVIHDQNYSVVAVAHISRYNAGERFIENILSTIERAAQADPERLLCYIGPCIRKESYGLPPTVPQASDPAWQPFAKRQTDGNISLDLAGMTATLLQRNGMLADNIQDSKINTATSADHFSHYRDSRSGEPEGRFAIVAGLR